MTLDQFYAAALVKAQPHPCDNRLAFWWTWARRNGIPISYGK